MQERLIREMVKLRGGPTRLKILLKEYEEKIEEIGKDRARLMNMRDLILKLTSDEESADEDDDGGVGGEP